VKEQGKMPEQMADEAAEKQRDRAEEAREVPAENPAADQLAAAAEKQAEAQDQARQAAEQTAKEQQAKMEAAARAEEAEKARQAAEKAPQAEKEVAQSAAEEARRQAEFAAEFAVKEKQGAEEIAKRAIERLASAEEDMNVAQMTAEQAAANNPLAPKPGAIGVKPLPGAIGAKPLPGAIGAKPLPGGSGGGVLGEAKNWLGVPYDYSHSMGMTRKGVDCSAFTAAVYSQFGITLPDSPIGQLGMGAPVSGPAKAGDLVFFDEDGGGAPTHVGIANGDGTLTHSSNFTGEVSVTDMDYLNGYMGARRLL